MPEKPNQICLRLWKDYKAGKITLAELHIELEKIGTTIDNSRYSVVPKEVSDIAKQVGGRVERGCPNDDNVPF